MTGAATSGVRPITHGLRPMGGRDPRDGHRAATPLELLYDLVFVISFGVAGSEFAHLLAEGHYRAGLIGFSFAMFAVTWAWINFTWFASAYDTDDWWYRILTMIQMLGVVVLALGLPDMFHSVDANEDFEVTALVIGYVIMRVPMVVQWLRAGRQDPDRRRACTTYAAFVTVAQIGWCCSLLVDVKVGVYLALVAPLFVVELLGPYAAERRDGGTPWHPHHIAERYGLLTIITLGEVLIGTVAALNSVIESEGWSFDVVVLAVAGVGLMFGLWWVYFLFPFGDLLAERRQEAFVFGYGHFLIYAPLTAVGAGLHVAALYLERHAEISATAVMWTIAVPVIVFFIVASGLFAYLLELRPALIVSTLVKVAVVVAAVGSASADVELVWCVLVLALAPAVSVVATELGWSTSSTSREPGAS
jgi:low temperature requirement protein LtrA